MPLHCAALLNFVYICCFGPEQAPTAFGALALSRPCCTGFWLSRPSCICVVLALCWPLVGFLEELGLSIST